MTGVQTCALPIFESVTGIETLKAMAVEPQMQRRWEEQLAGYVGASFSVLSLGNMASNAVQLVSKLVTVAIIVISVLPGVYEFIRARRGHKSAIASTTQPVD